MKFTVRAGLSLHELCSALPPAHRRLLTGRAVPAGEERYTLLLFRHDRADVILSAVVRKALERVVEAPGLIVAAAGVFTLEALAALHLRGALVLALSDFTWTDASYEAIRRPLRTR